MEGRTGPQCSNRWKKSLDPSRTRKGSFTPDEDKRLKIAVMLFGPKNWNKKAQFILGRNQVQCRERWYNCLDPNLKRGKWTEEEDSRLEEAIRKHGYSWAKVATWVPSRTDSECRRRWTKLFPHEVPLLQEARRIQKAALIGNFVDREEERSSLGPSDFHPLPIRNLICGPESTNTSVRNTRKPSRKPVPKKEKSASCLPKTEKFKKSGKKDGGVDTVNKRFPAQKRMQLLKFSKETNSLLDEFYSTINGTNKTKKSSKKLSRSRKTTSRTRLDQNSTGSSGMPVSTKTTNDIDHDAPSHDQDSALLQITNGEEIIGLGGNEGNNLPEESSSLSSQSRNPDKAVVASVDKSCVPQRKRKRKYETSDECQQAEHKKAKQQRLRTVDANDLTASLCGSKLIMKKPETEGIVQENLSDPQSNNLDNTLTTLACLLQDKSKNMVVALNDSGRSENDNEVGDVTLASMLRNKSKKKKPSS